MDVPAKFGDSVLNSSRIIRLVAGRTRFTHFCAVFNCNFAARAEAAIDDISSSLVRLTFIDKRVKFCDFRLNRSGEIQPKAGGGGIFRSFFAITSDRKFQ